MIKNNILNRMQEGLSWHDMFSNVRSLKFLPSVKRKRPWTRRSRDYPTPPPTASDSDRIFCPACGRLFMGSYKVTIYRQHYRTVHMGIKDYTCKYCRSRFAKDFNRKRHENVCVKSPRYGYFVEGLWGDETSELSVSVCCMFYNSRAALGINFMGR